VLAVGGGFDDPKFTSYDVAPVAVHAIVTDVADTLVAPADGDGDAGVDGGGVTVVKVQTGPAVEPLVFFATTCQ
jgi:hypothetical protein